MQWSEKLCRIPKADPHQTSRTRVHWELSCTRGGLRSAHCSSPCFFPVHHLQFPPWLVIPVPNSLPSLKVPTTHSPFPSCRGVQCSYYGFFSTFLAEQPGKPESRRVSVATYQKNGGLQRQKPHQTAQVHPLFTSRVLDWTDLTHVILIVPSFRPSPLNLSLVSQCLSDSGLHPTKKWIRKEWLGFLTTAFFSFSFCSPRDWN